MECSVHNGLINIDITIPDFEVKAAIRISADPSFVVNIRPLATEIRQGHQVSRLASLTFRETFLFHELLLPTNFEFSTVYNTTLVMARGFIA